MKEHNDDIHLKHLLQDKLEEHTVVAPDFVWSAIEKEMFPPTKKRRPIFWWFLFTGLFLGSLSFYFFYSKNELNFTFKTKELAAVVKSDTRTAKSYNSSQSDSEQILSKNNKNQQENINNNSEISEQSENDKVNSVTHLNVTNTQKQSIQNKKEKNNYSNKQSDNNLITKSESGKNEKTIETNANVNLNQVDRETENKLNTYEEAYLFELNLLSAKKLDHLANSIPIFTTNLRYPRKFVPYSFIDLYSGIGRNHREYTGSIGTNQSSKALLFDRTIKFKNKNFGLDYNLQFCRFASLRLGINTGSNRYTTRLFPIRIANVSLNDPLDISSPSGDLKSAPLDLDDQASTTSDSTTFLMRIIHKSRYYTVPLSIRFNTTNIRGPQFFAFSGLDFNFRGSDQNTLIVRRLQIERVFTTSKPANAQRLYLGWHLGIGIASNPIRRLQVFSEFNYSSLFSDYYTGKIVRIQSSNYQINVGLRFKLVSNYDAKRLVK